MDTPAKIDKHISAMLPEIPKDDATEREKEDVDLLRTLIQELMIHSPCLCKLPFYCSHKEYLKPSFHIHLFDIYFFLVDNAADDLDAWCQQRLKKEHQGRIFPRCTKDYPKSFENYTSIQPDGSPRYRRLNNDDAVEVKSSSKQKVISEYIKDIYAVMSDIGRQPVGCAAQQETSCKVQISY